MSKTTSAPSGQPAEDCASNWFSLARDLTLKMVEQPSITGTPGEACFAPWLMQELSQWTCFQRHSHHLWLMPTLNDTCERPILFALVRGQGPETVILTGHYDVVGTENFGHLSSLAFHPEALKEALLSGALPAKVEQDLQQGFLPGRGMLDMKSGLAAGLTVLHEWDPSTQGNLLFIAVPDEEETSLGMRSAVQMLPEVLKQHDLTLVAAINLDATTDQETGEDGQAIFLGSVGKLLPFVWIQGCPTHSGAPIDGINAAFLSSELVRLLEWNPAFGEGGEDPAPPITVLYQSEIRSRYDVTTPAQAWTVFNVLTHHRRPADVLNSLKEACIQSFADALQTLHRRQFQFVPDHQATVLTFQELVERASQCDPEGTRDALSQNPKLDARAASRECCTSLAALARISGPAYVVGFAPPFYPSTLLGDSEQEIHVRSCMQEVVGGLQKDGLSLKVRSFYPGISDMSFIAPRLGPQDLETWAQNAAVPERWTVPDVPLNCPVVNIGPWGRDYHQKWERVHEGHAFGWLPEVLQRACLALLSSGES
ncbi:M20/M25/M40 family metallo-hydrolase [Deinococcus cellulosilyticus]|uniref:Arginine utilization protein RocB n=1 Tax=Deinococcus cellulosilyticus (strain DSM 18568 / NBRC 106333 / KACC 11606 / 5516J-15) TaxID=1223518 RepID=A0A511N0A7_DEIC1|nr:M20/M25/M40 family metallo-hydrolase [Deinococcus cellulosilyticus]GEM46282.1 arginine utilization protein RocB [Deinococcus cellulosilyticus NBRC 106333 = KACC 11606]